MRVAPDSDSGPSNSSELKKSAGITGVLRAALTALALVCFRRPVHAVLVLGMLAALGFWSAGNLKLDPDVTQLLPPSYESVQQVQKLRDRFGGVGNVVVMVNGGSSDERRAYADALAPKLAELASVKFVDHRVPVEFFSERGLYFADQADLEALRDRLEARKRWEIERSFVDIDDEKPPSVDVSDLTAKYEQRFSRNLGRSTQAGASAYYEDEQERLAIFIRPTKLASDLDFSKQVVADVERVIAELPPPSGIEAQLTGRYKKRVDLQALLGRDLKWTSLVASVLILLYVSLHFRRPLAVVMVLLPLGLGILWSYGLAGALFGKLNVLTAFIGAILVGISIDNGLHLLGRYQEEVRRGLKPEAAIAIAFGEAGRVALAAALTTASAFIALTWTDFRAFREFGVLAGSGMLLLLFAYITLLPALLGLLTRFAPRLAEPPAARHLPGVPWMQRFASPIFWLLALGGFFVISNAQRVHFDADFSKLDDADLPSFHLDKEVNKLLGRSQTPIVILAESPAQSREIAEAVRLKMAGLGSAATIGLVATRADILPEGQAEKREILVQLRKTLSRFKGAELDEATNKNVERLRKMADAEPFAAADLPPSLRYVFEAREGATPVEFVLLYPTVGLGEAEPIKRLAAQLRRVELPSGQSVAAAGEPIVLADVLLTVERDAPRIIALTFVLVLSSLILALGKLRLALLALAPAVFTLAATAGAAALLRLDLNYLNMIVLPILLGIGVDDGAHLVARVEAGEPLGEVWSHTGWDVTGAILTDVFGFGVLAFAAHPGLSSLGKLAILGLTINFIACVVLLPMALSFLPLAGAPRARWSLATWLSTSFGAGRSPVAPGTVGALLAIPLTWSLLSFSVPIRLVVLSVLTVVAVVAAEKYLREQSPERGAKDPQEIVIDETVGCAIPLVVLPWSPLWVGLGFALFRLFDIFKPGPIRWADQRLRGGFGVVADDVLAGVFAAVVLLVAKSLFA